MKITNEILEAHLNCNTKGLRKLAGESGTKSDYEMMSTEARQASREAAVAKLVARIPDASRGVPVTVETLKEGKLLLADATLEDEAMSLHLEALKRSEGASKLGDHHYVPVLHVNGVKVGTRERLFLAVFGLALSGVQGFRPAVGLVICGPEGRPARVELDGKLYGQAEQALGELKRIQAGGEPSRLVLNKHCQQCEFRQRCHEEAVKADEISLLSGVGEKELKRYNRKGIFTLTQLSCSFRPRRRSRRSPPLEKRQHALHAMAIRDRRIYLFWGAEPPRQSRPGLPGHGRAAGLTDKPNA
ncbi:ISPsy5, transposase [Fimbriiglobus ruber]|uniref:ISPsy5, transposase n=2 Tax=Fimbriiglobus ruber TaxID=1908690 RepID=A0A225CZ47_9BACT|nr:ISPsy5, transposase [Fimbriiglobus ruber]